MRNFIKFTTGLLTCAFLCIIIVLIGVTVILIMDATSLDKLGWIYSISALMILCNGVVYAILDSVDTLKKQLT